MRVLVLGVLAACTSPAASSLPQPHPMQRQPATTAGSPMIPSGSPHATVEAPPSGPLHVLGVTPDGGAAITVDEQGGVRLWPALDGSREPRAMTIAEPIEIALARRDRGYIAAEIDQGHGLELVELDPDGGVIAHRTLGNDPTVDGVAAFDGGILAWTSDQKIAMYGVDGSARGTLGTRPGERLVTLATAADHVVAEVEVRSGDSETSQRRVRALTVVPALAWGEFVDAGISPGGPIALARSGKRLVVVAAGLSGPDHIVAIDIARGATIGDIELSDPITMVAFADEAHIGAGSPRSLQWFEEVGLVPAFVATKTSPAGLETLASGTSGRVIGLSSGSLLIGTPKENRYLGYGVETPSAVAAGEGGTLLLASSTGVALVDPDLRTAGTIAFGAPVGAIPAELAWLGGGDWLVQAREDSQSGVLRVGSTHGDPKVVEPDAKMLETLLYEPSTQLVTTSFGEKPGVYRWDPARRMLTAIVSQPKGSPYRAAEIVPTAPARAGGVKLVRVQITDKATVEWFSDDHMTQRTATIDVASVLAIDASGNVYAWVTSNGATNHVAILANGREVGTLPLKTPGAVFPDATGKHVAVVTGANVALYTGGALAWSLDVRGTRSVVWLADGGLVQVTATGLVRLDLASGAPIAKRCGWEFGFSAVPLSAPSVEPMCVRD
jgi:hypothetical protein